MGIASMFWLSTAHIESLTMGTLGEVDENGVNFIYYTPPRQLVSPTLVLGWIAVDPHIAEIHMTDDLVAPLSDSSPQYVPIS
jgi:hypothetical protein